MHDPEAVAEYADYPVNENDLHARHTWLRAQVADFVPRLEADPDFYDAKIAGWWVWGMACWIGGGFCGDSGSGPWQVVNGRRVHLGNAGDGLLNWFTALANRLRFVRVCCGDWARIVGDSPTIRNGLTGVFLDPPYSAEAGRENNLYREEDTSVAHAVRAWAIENGDRPLLRIAFCGYEGEHEMPSSWTKIKWKASGGYAHLGKGQGLENRHREVIWFSPHCLDPRQTTLFDSLKEKEEDA